MNKFKLIILLSLVGSQAMFSTNRFEPISDFPKGYPNQPNFVQFASDDRSELPAAKIAKYALENEQIEIAKPKSLYDIKLAEFSEQALRRYDRNITQQKTLTSLVGGNKAKEINQSYYQSIQRLNMKRSQQNMKFYLAKKADEKYAFLQIIDALHAECDTHCEPPKRRKKKLCGDIVCQCCD